MAVDRFSWLHLTEFHFGLKGQKFLWPNLRQPFLNDLADLHRHTGPWRFIPDYEHGHLQDDHGTPPETIAVRFIAGSTPAKKALPTQRKAIAAPSAAALFTPHSTLPSRRPFFGREKELATIAKAMLLHQRAADALPHAQEAVAIFARHRHHELAEAKATLAACEAAVTAVQG